MNGITKETFQHMEVEDKLNVLFDILQSQKTANKVLASVMGGVSGALTVIIYFLIQFMSK